MSFLDSIIPPGPKTEVSTTTREETKKQKMSYLDTLRVKYAGANFHKLSGATAGGQAVNQTEKPASPLVEVLSMGFMGKGSSQKTETQDSGWSVQDSWVETQWDKVRYAVGVRDLRAFSYTFAERSERVSTPYRTPKPIRKVTLITDELIPEEFNQGGQMRPWILYWVSFNDGGDWHPLAPFSVSSMNRLDGAVIPVTINVNSGIPEDERDPRQAYYEGEEVTAVRLKWRLERPASLQDRTPVLKGYRLQLSVEGGL